MQLSPTGQFLYDNLQNVTTHYPYAEIPLFVVMPNHWHAIVFIDSDKIPYQRRACAHVRDMETETQHVMQRTHVETGRAPSLQPPPPSTINEQMQKIDSFKPWLSISIGGIKSATTKFTNENNIDFAWQTRFHDHIIRDQKEMNRIAGYIENNPATWNTDYFNGNM
jgi:REP element-mobilizing transposase RayT